MHTLLIATRNAHKVGEISQILGPSLRCLTLREFPNAPGIVEDADTFAGNATKKSLELARWLAAKSHPRQIEGGSDLFVLADDSGLEVDALNGAPGVLSARFAADETNRNSPDAANNLKLLRLLRDVSEERRTARFRCVIALTPVLSRDAESASPVCYADEMELRTELFDGACEGRIMFEPRGAGGFGYDPLFVPTGFEQSFAELGEETKNRISHRARALVKLRARFGGTFTSTTNGH